VNCPGELNAADTEFDDVIPLHEIESCLPLSHEAATEQCSQSCFRGVHLSHEAATAEAILDPFRCGNLPHDVMACVGAECFPLQAFLVAANDESLHGQWSGLLGIFCQKGGHNSGRRYCLQITLPLDLRCQAPALLAAACFLQPRQLGSMSTESDLGSAQWMLTLASWSRFIVLASLSHTPAMSHQERLICRIRSKLQLWNARGAPVRLAPKKAGSAAADTDIRENVRNLAETITQV
jgi:hypothetical protein